MYSPKFTELLAPLITELGYQCVGCEYLPGRGSSKLVVYIDHDPEPITVDDCERVSREVSALLDVKDLIASKYTLEVSSPGLDRPLYLPEHYARFVGAQIELALIAPRGNRRRYKGMLASYEAADASFELNVDGVLHRFNFDEVQKARLVPDYSTLGRRAATDASDE